jgi:hypothetical protein
MQGQSQQIGYSGGSTETVLGYGHVENAGTVPGDLIFSCNIETELNIEYSGRECRVRTRGADIQVESIEQSREIGYSERECKDSRRGMNI